MIAKAVDEKRFMTNSSAFDMIEIAIIVCYRPETKIMASINCCSLLAHYIETTTIVLQDEYVSAKMGELFLLL